MSHYTMLCKYGKQTRDFWGVFIPCLVSVFLYYGGVFKKNQLFHSRLLDEIGYSQRALME